MELLVLEALLARAGPRPSGVRLPAAGARRHGELVLLDDLGLVLGDDARISLKRNSVFEGRAWEGGIGEACHG